MAKDLIQEKYEQLPPELKKAIDSSDLPKTIQSIGKKHGLLIDQTGALGEEVSLIMLGITHPNDAAERFEDGLKVPYEKALEILVDVNSEILLPIRERLLHLQDESDIEPIAIQTQKQPVIIQTNPISKEQVLADIEDESINNTNSTVADKKLNTQVVTPPQKINIGEIKRSNDPYRESIE